MRRVLVFGVYVLLSVTYFYNMYYVQDVPFQTNNHITKAHVLTTHVLTVLSKYMSSGKKYYS